MTPSAASSKILVSYRILLGQSAGNMRATRLAKSVAGASYSAITNVNVYAYAGNTQSTSHIHPVDLEFLDTPSYSLGTYLALSTGAGFIFSYILTINIANIYKSKSNKSLEYKTFEYFKGWG